MTTINPDDIIVYELRAATPAGQSTAVRFTVTDEAEIEKLMKKLRKKGWSVTFFQRNDACSYERALANIEGLEPFSPPVKQ